MDKPSSIVALIIGAVAGFLVGRTTAPSVPMAAPTAQVAQNGQPARAAPAAAAASPASERRPQPRLQGRHRRLAHPRQRGRQGHHRRVLRLPVPLLQPRGDHHRRGARAVRPGRAHRLQGEPRSPSTTTPCPRPTAALAAGKQGKFWEMYDLLFKNQAKLGADDLAGYAQSLGLNMDKFKADMASSEVKAQITKEQQLAASLGASGTPAFFINGHKLVGAQPIESFKTVIDGAEGRGREEAGRGHQAVRPVRRAGAEWRERAPDGPCGRPGRPRRAGHAGQCGHRRRPRPRPR